MANQSEIFNGLPMNVRARFASIGSYVKAIIEENEIQTPKNQRLGKAQVQAIQLLVFIHFLDQFFQEGSAAAQHTVDKFKELRLSGFQVGTTDFRERNENVMLGAKLSEELRNRFQNLGIFENRYNRMTIPQLTKSLMRRARNG